jgi:hypothetical protein
MKPDAMRHAPQITDEVIMTAFEGTNFGRTDYRAFLGYSVLKKACHWHCGHTITTIMVELGLITPKAHRVTKLGRMFLSDCYDDPMRIKSVPAADHVPDGWKLVPVEPTEEMIAAGDQFMDGLSRLGDAYDAMLAAAPEVE